MNNSLDALRPAQAVVDLDRLRANYRALAAFSPVPLMPVLKADAYGHGAREVARALVELGAPLLAVAYVEEAVELRRAGIATPIVVLAGFAAGQVPVLVEHRLTPVVSTPDQLRAVLACPEPRRLAAHIKVDTGMGRLGFAPAELPQVAGDLQEAGLVVEGLMTHLARADEDAAFTHLQLDRFDAAVSDLARTGLRPKWTHAANSAGLAFLRPSHTLARPGLLLYGLRPRPLTPEVEVQPVMTVSARIALVKEVEPGTPISYGGRFVTARPSRIATVPIGYADGVPRTPAMAERGSFRVGGRRVPVAGTVCMDLTTLDVTSLPQVRAGEPAVLLGDAPTAWEVAEAAGTNAWAALTGIGARVPRVYVEAGRVVAVASKFLPDPPPRDQGHQG
ncbi:MAG TPA: alanine racemase [Vicinamibacteria bacterium]|nr:alanine racemase [Vicinamibacteria bacterium]